MRRRSHKIGKRAEASGAHPREHGKWEEIWLLLPPLVRQELYRQTHSVREQEVDDLCQDIWLRLMEDDGRRLTSYDHTKGELEAWLRVVVRNHLSNLRKRASREQPLDLALGLAGGGGQNDDLHKMEQITALNNLSLELSADDRMLLNLLREGEMGTKQIASLLGSPVRQVRKRKYNLIQKIKKMRMKQ